MKLSTNVSVPSDSILSFLTAKCCEINKTKIVMARQPNATAHDAKVFPRNIFSKMMPPNKNEPRFDSKFSSLALDI